MLGRDVTFEGYCTKSLAYRTWTGSYNLPKFMVIGNPHYNNCQRTPFPGLITPNGWQMDTLISSLAHELIEGVTTPYDQGWDVYEKGKKQVGDLCVTDIYPLKNDLPGKKYNQLIGGKFYILQNIWDHEQKGCDKTRRQDTEDSYDHDELRK